MRINFILLLAFRPPEYSSSFQEMGLAIDQAIKSSEINYEFDELEVLSPAQQSIITCIWRSLKVCSVNLVVNQGKQAFKHHSDLEYLCHHRFCASWQSKWPKASALRMQ